MIGNMDCEREPLHEAIAAVLKTDAGRQCFFWLLSLCGLYEDGFTGQDNLTNYRLGRQSVGKQIIAQMNAMDGALYPRFLLECAKDPTGGEARSGERGMKRTNQQECDDE